MGALMANWDSSFVVAIARDVVLPVLGGGVAIAAAFWIVGYVVNGLFRIVRGG